MTTAERKLEWIAEQVAAGRTVYLKTALLVTPITRKTIGLIRAQNGSLQVLRGKLGWIDYNGAKITAE